MQLKALSARSPPLVLLPIYSLSFFVFVGCGASDSASAELEATVTASANATGKATYKTLVTIEEEEKIGTVTVVQRPPDRRVDVVFDGMEESFLLLDGEPIECRELACRAAAEDSDASVFDRLGLAQDTLDFRATLLEQVSSGGDVKNLPGRVIAGMDGTCFEVSASGARQDSRILSDVCFSSSNGFLLLYDFQFVEDQRGFLFEATSVQEEVVDADLALPLPLAE